MADTKKKLLVVDGSMSARRLLIEHINAAQFQCFEAASGEGALETLQIIGEVDLIISEFSLPRMSGLALIEAINAHPAHRGTPIIIVTPTHSPELKEISTSIGARAWLLKPVSREELSAAIASTLGWSLYIDIDPQLLKTGFLNR